MAWIDTLKFPPPAMRTLMTQSGSGVQFAAHNGLGKWFTVPAQHEMEAPDAWWSKLPIKGAEWEPRRRMDRGGQVLMGGVLFGSETPP